MINISDELKKQEQKEAELYPDLCQGLDVLNEAGEWVIGRKKEQFIAYARGFILSGIIGELNGNAVKVLNVIAGFTNKFRNTTITNETIMKYAGICRTPLHNALKELKFYHVISSHYLSGGSRTKKRRCINLNRWDTAKPLLIKENKIVVGLDNKVTFVIPNPYRKN